MGLGLENAYGAAGGADALRQLIRDRLIQKQQEFENARLTANDARTAEEHAAKMQDYRDALAQRAQAERETTAGKALPALGIGGAVDPEAFKRTFSGTASESLFTPERTLPATQTAGAMPLPAGGSGELGAGVAPTEAGAQTTTEAPRQITGRMLSMGTDQQRSGEEQKMIRGRLLANPDLTDRERLMIGMENAGLKVPANMEAKPTVRQPVQVGPQGIYMDPADAIGKPGYHAPQQTATVTIQTVDDQGNPVTRVVPKKDAMGKDFAHPSVQDQQHTRTNKEAQDTLSQLDQAIENAKDLIGPGAGRVSSIEQMVGSADPRIQALGVKMKAAKMRVDHAVTGSVRAGASPKMMEQWDNILANKVTPEGLKAGVQAMREIIGGQDAKPGSGIKSITEIK